ncbi:MAG: biopolymer transporter ExbD [Deltaproteobacteria bacterium]|nr:biopolymer transporter ExbD [Deltaproteobacteria bacterium]
MKVSVKKGHKTRIEMLPLIDIVFLLLVFFIYAMLSMAVHRGMPVRLPSSTSAEIDKNSIVSVTLKEDGTLYLNRNRISLDDLRESLILLPAVKKERGLLLFADGASSYQALFHVMDEIRHAGILNISLQAEARYKP